ncbi:unnamed protein product [Moneuplotes crassus]|uniref:Uncharacterized protein n=1 Tax=Euplotes crassus TaxID=5936 RepID=A0AAD1Y7J6_EUPCR|nr:unnamed protein product [Moneuplotes crassus]
MVHCESGNLEEVIKLVNKWSKKRVQAELRKTNSFGNTSLSLAVKNNHHSLTQFLLEQGADVNDPNHSRQPLLFMPCWKNDLGMVKILLEHNADLNFQDSRGWTALMIASAQGFEDLVKYLLDCDADTTLKDKYGKQAIDKAKSHKIFYMLSQSAVEQNRAQLEVNDERILPDLEIESLHKSGFKAEFVQDPDCSSIKKELFNSPELVQDHPEEQTKAHYTNPKPSINKSPISKRKRAEREQNVKKVIQSSIKRNAERMNVAQKSVFSALIQEEILESSNRIFQKLYRSILTSNDKLKQELVSHVDLKLKVACLERGIFKHEDFTGNRPLDIIALSDVKCVSNKAFKMTKKEQNKIEQVLRSPEKLTPKRQLKKKIEAPDTDLSGLKYSAKDLEALISEQVQEIEDINVKNCAKLIKDIIADKITKLQNIVEENIERKFEEIQRSFDKTFTQLIEEKCNFLFTQGQKAAKYMLKETPNSSKKMSSSLKRVKRSASKPNFLSNKSEDHLFYHKPKDISYNGPLIMRVPSNHTSESGTKVRKYTLSKSFHSIPKMSMTPRVDDEHHIDENSRSPEPESFHSPQAKEIVPEEAPKLHDDSSSLHGSFMSQVLKEDLSLGQESQTQIQFKSKRMQELAKK